MHRTVLLAVALATAMPQVQAQDALPQMREELKKLRDRIQELERRVEDAESAATQASAQSASSAKGESALNPGISAILNGVYANLRQEPGRYRINGFVPTMGEVAPPPRGFSLGESELGFAANIDPMFRGTLVAAIAPDSETIGIEEAYVETLALARGFTLKAGRSFSAIGYQNQLHAHAWDFTDAPLVMKAFLGGQRGNDGVQLKWIAPTAMYWDLGGEVGRGAQFPGSTLGKNGAGDVNLFTHVGGDIGDGVAWQAGLSHLRTSPRDRAYDDPLNGLSASFSGTSRLWALDGVLKWAPGGNAASRNLKLQAEYFHRSEDGDLNAQPYASRQSGWYAQTVYQFMPQWRVGYRYDELDSGSAPAAAAASPILAPYRPKRHSAMLDWSPSEFSRIRLQLARDDSRMDAPDNQVFLQYIMSLGAHGAHRF
ncbi:MAG TPA: hypothetical protein VIV54_14270 [Burkholderiales bacterium]